MLRLMLNKLVLVPWVEEILIQAEQHMDSRLGISTFLCFRIFLAASVCLASFEPEDPAPQHLEYHKMLP